MNTLYLGDAITITSEGLNLGGRSLFLDNDSSATLGDNLDGLSQEIAGIKTALMRDSSDYKLQIDALYKYLFRTTPSAALSEWGSDATKPFHVLLVSSAVDDFLKTFYSVYSDYFRKNVLVIPYDWDTTDSYTDLLALIEASINPKLEIASVGVMHDVS